MTPESTETTARRWRYEAADAQGVTSRGEVQAATAAEAADALRRRSLWVITLEADGGPLLDDATRGAGTRQAVSVPDRLTHWLSRLTGGGGTATLTILTRSVATLLEAGVPLERALSFAASGDASDRWYQAFQRLREAVVRGESLSSAATRVPELPSAFAPLLAAAEATGGMAATFVRLADDLEQREQLKSRIQAALVYPSVLALASTVGTTIILLVVVPRFADLIAGAGGKVPVSTQALIAVGAWLTRFGWILLASLVLAVVAARQALQAPARRERWHRWRLTVPIVGRFEQQLAAAGYLSTLAAALESGVPLLRSMSLGRAAVRNVALAAQMGRAEDVVRDGGALASALTGSLPALAVRLLQAGEQSGALAALSRRAAVASTTETTRLITSSVALIEPVMILGFGGVVGFVALALLQAIYGLNAGSF